MTSAQSVPSRSRLPGAAAAAALAAFAVILVAGLTWAKWWPYSHRLATLLRTHAYAGGSVLDAAGPPGSPPSWHAAWDFAVAYGKSVWIALVAALGIGAGIEALVPRRALVNALRRPGRFGGPLVGGALSLPCMMCTCCTAPVTTSLRRSGVPTPAAMAYWLGNPTLNPAVLAFLALVLPWQYVGTRLAIGMVLVFLVPAFISRAGPRTVPAEAVRPEGVVEEGAGVQPERRPAVVRYLRALFRLIIVLVPEYLVVVLAVGAFRGWLLPLGGSATRWGFAAVLIAAVAGTLLVIPTGGEIPVITGLIATGFGAGVAGALLVALPAISLPSMVMVGRSLTWRATIAMAGAVVACALAAAALLPALGG